MTDFYDFEWLDTLERDFCRFVDNLADRIARAFCRIMAPYEEVRLIKMIGSPEYQKACKILWGIKNEKEKS